MELEKVPHPLHWRQVGRAARPALLRPPAESGLRGEPSLSSLGGVWRCTILLERPTTPVVVALVEGRDSADKLRENLRDVAVGVDAVGGVDGSHHPPLRTGAVNVDLVRRDVLLLERPRPLSSETEAALVPRIRSMLGGDGG